jgi:hypothetical protein
MSMSRVIHSTIRKHGLWGMLFVALVACAGTTYSDFLNALAQRESSMNQYAVNRFGYAGLYQMGTLALQDAGYKNASGAWTGKDGVFSQSDYLANAQAQTNAVTAYQQKAETYIVSKGLNAYIGTTIDGVLITASGLIAGYHLVGPGALLNFVKSGLVTFDGNGVPITTYIQQFAGYGLPVNGTTYASVLAATPTGGVATVITPSSPYATTAPLVSAAPLMGLGGASGLGYATAADGFFGATGYQMGDVRNLMVLLAAALFTVWFAHTLMSSWMGFAGGKLSIFTLKSHAVQGAVVVMLLSYLIW